MNNYLKSFFILSFSFSSLIAISQEICDNGIDDDGDGLIDCFDGECASNAACDDFFFGNTVSCSDEIDVNTFAIREQWGSADESATSHTTPAIGDLDRNGIPEVVSVNNYGSLDLFVLNGATGATIASADIGFTPENAPIIADVNNDETGDIIVSQNKGDDLALYNVDVDLGILTRIWRERASVNQSIGLPGVADFDEDGDVEIYYRNEIMDAATGTVIIPTESGANWEQDYTHGSIAVDILDDAACADCAGLELISGNEIWSINEATATRTLVRDMDNDIATSIDPSLHYYPKYYPNWDDQWSTVSVADYNLDGNIDVIMTGALGTTSETYNGETTIFFWDVANATVTTYHDPSNNFVRGPGRVNIGDVDGDGQLNANFVMDQRLYSLDENFGIHWIHGIKEGSSGFTGCSLFDFDGDGAVEVVYRSEESLLIVDGVGNGDQTTSERREIACVSRTQEEYPVIADVDGDGSSEICVSCYFNNNTSFSPYRNTQFSQIRVYESDGEAWMPSRGVWNQHGYYNVNINDDLTVPTEVQDHSVVFSTAGTCELADGSSVPFDSRPLNTFINQAPILNEDGCVEFVSPDIDFVGILSATDAECPDATITVEFEITNIGDTDISGNLPVSYYAGDPRLATGSTLLDTEITLLTNFEVNSTLTVSQTITGIGGNFELFVVINDNGSTPPISVPLPTATIPECDTDNNIQSTLVGFQTFDLSVEKVNDNRKCEDSYLDSGGNTIIVPDNGEARAFYFGTVPGSNGSIWLENFEDRAIGDQSDTDETAWTTDQGTQTPNFYGVNTYSGSNMFQVVRAGTRFDEGEVTWTSQSIDISDHTDVSVTMDLFENGNQESSGEWRDYIIVNYELYDVDENLTSSGLFSNGSHFGDFNYQQAILTGVNNAGQGDSLLVITVTIHNTSSSENHYFDNISVEGTAIPVAFEQTEPEGFVFNWYNTGDYSSIIYTGSSFPQMDEGIYDVVGFFGATGCYSDTVSLEILRETPTIRVHTYEINQDTDCAIPNGEAGAFVFTSLADESQPVSETNPPLDTLLTADGYVFTWFLAGDASTPLFTGETLGNLDGNDYLVEVFQAFTGCTQSEGVTVGSPTTTIAGLQTSKVDITTCGGTGSISADVLGNTTDYTFYWYDGPTEKVTEDFEGVTYIVSDAGQYTVIAEDNTTKCTSDPVVVTIIDSSSQPTPTASSTPNTSCASTGNGTASADGDGAGTTAGFNYTWYLGNNTLASNELPAALAGSAFGAGDFELTGLTNGIYTLVVQDASTLCTDTITVDVADNIVDPAFNTTTGLTTSNTVCTGTPNGQIDLTGSVDPIGGNFEYSLYNGSGTTGTPTVNTTGIFDELSDGDYTVVVVDLDTGCDTDPEFLTVDPDPDIPVIATGTTDDTFCVNGDGTITVTSSSNVEPSAYTYEIFDGHSFSSERGSDISVADGTAGNTYTGLENGNYRIRVTHDDSGCSSFEDIVINDISAVPSFTATPTIIDNTACGTPNGQVTVSIQGGNTDFVFDWYDGIGTGSPRIIGTSDNFQTSLAAGDYTVVARNTVNGCQTVELTIPIGDDLFVPDVVIVEEDPDTSCGVGNGRLRAYVTLDPDIAGGDISGEYVNSYDFEWFYNGGATPLVDNDDLGNNSLVSLGGTNDSEISGLSSDLNNYTVVATHRTLGCDASESVILSENEVFPVLSLVSTQGNTSCDPTSYDGEIHVSATPAGAYTYRYFASDGSQVSDGAPVSGSSTADVIGLVEDTYRVVAESSLNCVSDTLVVVLSPNLDAPAFQVQGAGTNDNEVCNLAIAGDYSGQITVEPTDGTAANLYTYEWFVGASTDAADDLITNIATASISATGDVASELPGGTYTVVITEIDNNCPTTIQHTIDDATSTTFLAHIPSATPDDVNVCEGGTGYPDGGISIDAGAITTAGGSGSYTFRYYIGNSTSGTLITDGSNIGVQKGGANNGGNVSGATTATIAGLDPGSYTIEVVDNNTGCVTQPVTTTVDNNPDAPAFQVQGAGTNDNEVCDLAIAGDYSGQITVETTDGSATNLYTYEWYSGTSATTGNELTTIVPTASISAIGDVASELPGGTYTVVITEIDNNCPTTIQHTIDDATSTTFLAHIPSATPDDVNVCEGGTGYPDGGISIDAGAITTAGGSGSYTFRYYIGNSTSGTLITDGSNIGVQKGGANNGGNVSGATTATIAGLDPGSYTIEVVDNNTGCVTQPVTTTVDNNPDAPAFQVQGAGTNDNEVCDLAIAGDYSGQITVETTDGSATNLYTYEWYSGTSATTGNELTTIVTTASISATGDVASELPGGTYTVVITEIDNNCPTTIQHTIDDATSTTFLAHIPSATPDDVNVCEGGTGYPDGGISIDAGAITTAGGSGSYTFRYYIGNSTSGTLITDGSNIGVQKGGANNGGNVSGATTATIAGLDPGSYTIEVVDNNTGCVTQPVTTTVDNNPDAPAFQVQGAGTNDNEVCDLATAGDYSGQITVETTDGSATNLYTYEWYFGTSATTGNELTTIVPTASISTTGDVASELPGGTYTVVITEIDNNCPTTIQHTIDDATSTTFLAHIPSATPDDVNVCEGGTGYPDGGISIDAGAITTAGGSGSYTFRYYIGNSTSGTLITDGSNIGVQKGGANNGGNVSGATTATIAGLDPGSYTIEVVDNNTGCVTQPVTTIVDNNPDAPAFQVQGAGTNDNEVCDLATAGDYSGQITVETTDGSATNLYTYEWYSGTSATTGNELTTIVPTASISTTGDVASELPGGTYTVVITEIDNNCPTTIQHTIDDATSTTFLAHIPSATPDDVNVCEGGTGYPDGGISIDAGAITTAGGSGSYTFRYYIGNSTSGTLITDGSNIGVQKGGANNGGNVSGATTATIAGLDPGSYTIEVVDNNTGCVTQPVTTIVDNNPDAPAFQVQGAGTNDNEVCDLATAGDYSGQITVETTDGSATNLYTYEWYSGTSATTGNELTTIVPTASISTTGDVASELPGGTYTVVITEIDNNCPTTIQHTIDDATSTTFLAHIPSATPDDVNVCEGGTGYPDGGISIDAGAITTAGGSGSYTFRYYIGNSTSGTLITDGSNIGVQKGGANNGGNVSGATTATIAGLDPGSYTIEVVDNNTGCVTQPVTTTVDNNPDAPAFQVQGAGTNDNEVCDLATAGDYSGQITVETTDGSATNLYTYEWYFGTSATTGNELTTIVPTASISTTGDVASELPGGTYTVVITEIDNNCPTTIQHTIDDATSTTFLAHIPSATPDDVNVCEGGTGYPDGGISIDAGAITTAGGSGSYTFRYYIGNSTSGTLITDGSNIGVQKGGANNGGNVSGATTATIAGLDPGSYTIEVVDNNTGCVTQPVTTIVDNNPDAPAFQVQGAGTNDNEVCDLATAGDYSGQITVETTDGSATNLYTYEWYSGTSATTGNELTTIVPTASISTTGDVASELPGGTYTVVITEIDNNCPTTIQHTIDDATSTTFLAHIPSATPDDVNVCEGGTGYPDGGISIDAGAITTAGGSGSYTFRYYIGNSTSGTLITDGSNIGVQKGGANNGGNVSGATTATIAGLDPGSYTIEVVDNNTGCVTQPVTTTVDANPTDFSANINAIVSNEQSSCDFGNPIGQIQVDVSGSSSGHNFQLFPGQQTSNSEIITNKVTTGTEVTFSNLAAGIYTVLVTNTTTNCFFSEELTIINSTTNPAITSISATVDNTSCDSPTGQITVVANNNGSGEALDGADGYTFELYEGNTIDAGETPVTINENDNDAVFNGLADGDYVVRVIDNNTGCQVESAVVPVSYTGPTASFIEPNFGKVDISNCFTENGEIDVSNGGTGVTLTGTHTGDIVITWYAGTDTSAATGQLVEDLFEDGFVSAEVDFFDEVVGSTTIRNARMTGLPAISYTGVARLDNGCIEVFNTSLTFGTAPDVTVTVVDDPTRCAATFDGEISITLDADAGNNPAQYQYVVYEGNRTITPNDDGVSPFTPNLFDAVYAPILTSGSFTDATAGATQTITIADDAVLGQLEAGTYTVAVDFASDNCVVFVGTVTLEDPPVSTLTQDVANSSNNTICDVSGALTYNGVIEVDASNPSGGTFDFEWYYDADGDGDFSSGQTLIDADGADEAGAGSNVVGFETLDANTAIISGLGAGWYRVIAINDNAGAGTDCEATLDIQLFDEVPTFSIGNNSGVDWNLVNQVDCSGTGEFSLERVLQDGVVNTDLDTQAEVIGAFTLTWTNLTTSSTYNPNINFASGDDLTAGDYQIDLVHNTTGCTTTYTFTIEDQTIDPIIAIESSTDDTYCDNTNNVGDGTLSIDLFLDGTQLDNPTVAAGDYTVEWYRTALTARPGTGIADANFLFDNQGNSNADANVIGDAAVGADISILTGLSDGDYTVFINRTGASPNTNCNNIATFEIGNDNPTLSIATADIDPINNSICTAAAFPFGNGEIDITAISEDGDNTAYALNNYSFSWEKDGAAFVNGTDGTLSSSGLGTNNYITNLQAGTYTVTVQNTLTGCPTTALEVNIIIEDIAIDPIIAIESSTDDTYCDNTNNVGDGTLSIDLFLDGTQLDNPTVAAGDYTVEWYRTALTARPGTGIADANFLFDNQGNSNADANVIGDAAVGADISILTGLSDGDYTVFINRTGVSPNTNCNNIATFEIGNDNPTLSIATADIDPINNSICTAAAFPFGNGEIDITAISEDGDNTAYALNNYSFSWEKDGAAFVNGTDGTLSSSGLGTNNYITNLQAGTYTVTVQNTLTGCPTTALEVNIIIEDIAIDPIIAIESSTDDTYCDNTNNVGDGTLSIDLFLDGTQLDNPTVAAGDYTVEWYRTALTARPGTGIADANFLFDNQGNSNADANVIGDAAVGADISILTGLSDGDYTVFINRTGASPNTNCNNIATFEIGNDNPTLSIATADIDPINNSICTAAAFPFGNGEIDITAISEDGDNTAYALNNYSFSWEKDGAAFVNGTDGTLSSSGLGTNNYITNLQAGTYTVTVQNTLTGCPTTALEVDIIIEDIAIDPIIAIESSTDDTYCDNTNNVGDGTLSIDLFLDGTQLDNPTVAAGDYTVEWYRTALTARPGTGIADANFLFDNQSNSNADANVIGDAAVGADISILTGLSDGDYTVFINRTGASPNTNCNNIATFEIGNDNPTLSIATADIDPINNSICTAAAFPFGNGEIDITAISEDGDNTAYALNNYSFSWEKDGAAFVNGTDGTLSSSGLGTNNYITNLQAGTYTVTVQNTLTGCPTTALEVDIIIEDIAIDPIIAIESSTDDTYCDNTNNVGDGTLSIDLFLDGTQLDNPTVAAGDYTVEWYRTALTARPGTGIADANFLFDNQGNSNADANVIGDAAVGADISILTGLSDGDYTVFINRTGASPNTNCNNIATFEIGNDNPTLSIATADIDPINNSICTAAAFPFGNGEIDITAISEDGDNTAYALNNYSFSWEKDGAAFVNGTDGTLSSSGLGTNNYITNLQAGTYTVTVQNTLTGCPTTALEVDIIIEDIAIDPIIAIESSTDDTYCDNTNNVGDGTLSIDLFLDGTQLDNPTVAAGDYTVEWYRTALTARPGTGIADANFLFDNQGNSNADANVIGDAAVGADISILTGLSDGDYTVFINRTGASPNTNCNNIATFEIGNDNPTLSIATADIDPINNSICTAAAFPFGNGEIDITAISEDGDNTAYALNNYSFSWEKDGAAFVNGTDGTLSSSGLGTNNYITNLQAGTYTVTVQNTLTGCPTTALEVDIIIEDIAIDPIIAIESSTDDTYCDNTNNVGDGTLSIDLFLDGTQLDNPTVAAGDYTVEWYRTALTARPGTGIADANFLFDNQGNSNADANVIGDAAVGADISILTGLSDGDYTVFINRTGASPNTNCNNIATFEIGNDNPTLSIATADIDPINNSICTAAAFPFGNGEIDITAISEDGDNTAYALNNYSFSWEKDGAAFVNGTDGTLSSSGLGTNNYITNLQAGTYTVTVQNTLTGCPTTALEVDIIIEDIAIDPIIAIESSTDDTYCDNTNNVGDGTLSIDLFLDGTQLDNPTVAAGDYTVEWYRTALTARPGTGIADANFLFDNQGNSNADANVIGDAAVGADISILTGLSDGDYTVFINRTGASPNTNCNNIATFEIGNDNPTLSIATADIDPINNSICTAAAFPFGNGEIDITAISEDGDNTAYALNNYSFSWEKDGAAFVNGTDGTLSSSGLGTNNYITNLQAGTYTVTVQNTLTGCPTTALEVDIIIEDIAIDPIIAIESSTDDTYCDNTNNVGDGTLSIDLFLDGTQLDNPTVAAGDYTVEWYRTALTARPGTGIADANFLFDNQGNSNADANVIGDAAVGADISILTGLSDGDYTVFINRTGVSPNTNCNNIATFEVNGTNDTPEIDASTIQASVQPDSLCTGLSGTIIINDADIDGILDDYEVLIYQGSVGGTLSGTFTNNGSPTISLEGLAANDYFITARNTTTGCFTPTVEVNVSDSIRNPQIALISITPNEDCGGTVRVGGVEVLVDAQYDHTNQGFLTFNWTQTSSGTDINTLYGVAANEASISGVPEDDYTVTVTNTNTGCFSTSTFTVPRQDESIFITNTTTEDVTFCVDNGTFAILEISLGAVLIDSASMVGSYTLQVDTDDSFAGSAGTIGTTPNNLFVENLGVGSYFARVRKDDSNCFSDPVAFDIVDDISFPQVQIILVASDTSCVGGTPTGAVSATADGSDDTDPNYSFAWFSGTDTSSPLGINTSSLSGYADGFYTVEVTNGTSTCSSTATIEIPSIPSELSIISVDATGSTNCNPGNGTLTVTSVSDGAVTDYDFDYYDTDPTVGTPTSLFTGNAGAPYTTAVAGTYWIIGTHITLACTTPPFQINVDDDTTPPSRTGLLFQAQENCDPSNPNGSLIVEFDGVIPAAPDYAVRWYFGSDTSNPLDAGDIGTTLAGENTASVSGLPAGFYTVEVIDNTTGCSTTETFEMVDEIPNVQISTTSSANTNCVNPNGQVAVSVINPAPGRTNTDYSYFWFFGDLGTVGPSPNPANADRTGSLVADLPSGDYVVLVVDNVDGFCDDIVGEITIEDGTASPEYSIDTSNVTVCFDDKDGFAIVSTPDLSRVDIEWFDESLILIDTTFFADSLDAGNYFLRLTDRVTGCTTPFVDVIIGNDAVTPNSPFVLVNNGRNNCAFANGSAIANVDGITNNFLFEWFDPSDMTTPYATGSEVFNLDTITYLVRATDITTGCTSGETQVSIGYEVVDPTFVVSAENSICLRTEDGSTNQFTGEASISFDQFNLATDYEWIFLATGEIVGTSSKLIDAFPGEYGVRFIADNGCDYYAEFTIETELNIYNGVSANGDGRNDFFLIDCIDYFPGNNVKIFNRAGQRVFEIDNYDNRSNRFEGISNVGGGGLQLPPGTYFYLVDLNTGEDPIQGFIELVR